MTIVLAAIAATSAYASTVSSAAFTGGSGTVSAGGVLYAKNGGSLTLTVNTSSDTKCVEVTGAVAAKQTSATAKSTWSFSFTAGAGDGVQTVTAAASPSFNANNCTGQSQSPKSASFVLDNTGPTVTGSVLPVPNGAGWNNSNVTVSWTASDAGSGVDSGPTPASDSQQQNTAGATKTAAATDKLGNAGSGSVVVRLDKAAPTISGSRSPAANANGWNNTDVTVGFQCNDSLSGIKVCPGPTPLSSSGAGQSVTGTATDNADNSASATVSGINIDKVPPSLSGAPTTAPNGSGWYSGNVAIHWTASDALSGLSGSAPADSTISSEGAGLTATASVTDKAGNATTATSPAVNIDKTVPLTSVSAPSGWMNQALTLNFTATDALSGVASTWSRVDGGLAQQGSSAAVAGDGVHSVEYWSVDKAGNVEAHHTVDVKIDGTPPTITPHRSPAPNASGWNNTDVDVSFDCADALSGIFSCTAVQTITVEAQNHDVTGTAIDNAGNTATAHASVSIDKTPPSISAAADRAPNAAGWYGDDVTVSFTCGDSLAGVDTCPASKTVGEGANLTASGTATDAAGNSADASVNGIDVDKTPPSLSGAPTASPNGNGWYSGDVTVAWTCSDALAGIAGTCPADSTLTGEGTDLAASASVSDLAGNSTNADVGPIKIDRTPPTSSASVPAQLDSGWYAGPVQVTLDAVDSLSGVDATHYSVDGGAAQTYDGPFTVGGGGSHTVSFWSTDKAGNIEDKTADGHSITFKIDNVPPTITGSRTPAANGFGWNNTPVTVSFNCADSESGIAGCSDPTTLSGEGAGQSVTGNTADNAGNTAEATVKDINIDLTAPSLTGELPDSNAEGWYNGDVSVHWNAHDGLSGIDPASVPGDSTITGEGSSLGAGPVTVADKAGNTSSQSVTDVRIDRHGPSISLALRGVAGATKNAAGWWNGDVAVDFACSDPQLADGSAGSGVAACPSTKVVSGDGTNQSVTSDAAKDVAGNTTPGITVGGISIDGHAPQTTVDNQCTKVNGWCTGTTATILLTSNDVGPSGVKRTYYSINDGSWQSTASNPATVDVPLDGAGHAHVDYYSIDNADNAELSNRATIDYDNIAPAVTHTLTPAANAAGWNKDNTTVHFNATDNDSGVDITTVTPDVFLSSETSGVTVNGSAKDIAGNVGTDSVLVKLDKTPPTIGGSITGGALGNNGWYTSAVTVGFTCSDALSGIAPTACPDSVTTASNGANQSVTRSVTDIAGNGNSATVGPFKIDAEAPTITSVTPANGSQYVLGNVPAPACAASDSFSGVASCTVAVSGGSPNGVGTFTYTATATDNAGNKKTQTGSYSVIYNVPNGVPFFLQPINDTAHTVSTTLSVFKAGQTVPVKFQLKNAAGQIVQANAAPIWLTPAQGNATTSAVNESLFAATGDSGNTFRWDGTAQQYIYNWNTGSNQAGFYWKIGVKLDDGMTYYTDVGLRK